VTRRPQKNIPGLGYAPAGRKLDVDVVPFSDIRRRSPVAKVQATHRYDFHLVLLITEGSPIQMVDFEPAPCAPGALLVLRPGQVHSFGASLDWEGWLVMFRAEFLPVGSDQNAEVLPAHVLDHLPDHQLLDEARHRMAADAISAMATDTRAEVSDLDLLHVALRYQLCALILRLGLTSAAPTAEAKHLGPARKRFERFRTLLEANYSGWHQIGRYADALGCTPKSLNRAAQEATGLTAKDCIARRLALEAKRLLAHTDRPIYLIAEGLGFDEATNFAKFFRRQAGQSPAEFRAAHRA
jgi:AraC-like DNA-binding protein